jgi:hypothetical protein
VYSFKENITLQNSCIFIKKYKNGRISDHCNFNYSHEIIVIKHLLEQEAIHYFFENENLVSVDPLAFMHCGKTQNSF